MKRGIQVVVRVRPLGCSDADRNAGDSSLSVDSANATVEGLRFHSVYDQCTQKELFTRSVAPLVQSWIDGYSATVFAYGQTGSGKTYAMLGPDGGTARSTVATEGIIPRVASLVFSSIEAEQREFAAQCAEKDGALSQFQVRVSYVEIYNDALRDLLCGSSAQGGEDELSVREDANGRVFVVGAVELNVSTTADVMRAIELGTKHRVTGKTGMNAHSSRSHAVFILKLEHRWREPGKPKNEFRCTTSVMNLVDLAGSEYAKKTGNVGDQLRESAHINTGLFVLGNVISALAGTRKRAHVPYRDCTLTRILQSSLGGDSHTVMIACVSPADGNRSETMSTLEYAHSATAIVNTVRQNVERIVAAPGALDNDVVDPDGLLHRRTAWIDTEGFGPVFSRCVGHEADELILFVHGSGPTNSSTWWNGLVHELAVTAPSRYYMVAIDCPGYGRSLGDRQTIRSHPGAFLSAVVSALGKHDALCLVGSSQGACAVFNAVLEVPKLARHVVVMDPVGHDVFRYSAIKQPSLVIFDTEDAGHPVKVGRWMRENLARCVYHEFADSKTPYWHCDHMGGEMIKLLSDNTASFSKAVSEATVRLAGGLCSWAENNGFGEAIKQIRVGLLAPPSTHMDALANTPVPVEEHWRAEASTKTGRIRYYNLATGESTSRTPAIFLRPAVGEVEGTKAMEDLFSADHVSEIIEEESEEAAAARVQQERDQRDCEHCAAPLWLPHRMNECRHCLCAACVLNTVKLTKACPVCEVPCSAGGGHDAAHHTVLAALPDAEERQARHEVAMAARKKQCRIVLEYGNSATGGGPQYTMEASMRVAKVDPGTAYKGPTPVRSNAIARVDFDINHHYPGSAVKVMQPPFTLCRTMALAFSCWMTVHWSSPELPPLTVPYRMQQGVPQSRHAMVVCLSSAAQGDGPRRMSRKPKPVVAKEHAALTLLL